MTRPASFRRSRTCLTACSAAHRMWAHAAGQVASAVPVKALAVQVLAVALALALAMPVVVLRTLVHRGGLSLLSRADPPSAQTTTLTSSWSSC